VREIPRSGQPDELIDRYGISARHIVAAVRQIRKDLPSGSVRR
jgi:transketolase